MIYVLPFNRIDCGERLLKVQFDQVVNEASSAMVELLTRTSSPVEVFTGELAYPARNAFGFISSGDSLPPEVHKASFLDATIMPGYKQENIRWLLYEALPLHKLLNIWPDAMSLADLITDGYPLLPQHALTLLRSLAKGCSLETREKLEIAILTIHERYPDRPEFQAIGLYGDGSVVIPEHYNLSYLRRVLLPR